ncbi:hypothetical protein DK847_05530 [Aestuariivirga litoralis]|uniref:DoxX family protein n=1 Tax=Aestuariivirga litoralis TaxID=2650924 RepID=A0A2W2BCI4_9HYPH|nr:DUF6790 family protein [Aestuariivirga litoralis]PZF77888.1 hypothetical protein DK847_05530 [Aestuariivirga litoralis]
MAAVISYILSNIPAVCFALAILLALLRHDGRSLAARLLDWMLLLPVGIGGVWAGFFHITFPAIAAQSIGWQPSPFQFEIGVADAAIGIAGIVSFWRALPFKAAVVLYIVLFNFGVAVGHVRESLGGNFAPNNFGLLLVITIAEMVLLPVLLRAATRKA